MEMLALFVNFFFTKQSYMKYSQNSECWRLALHNYSDHSNGFDALYSGNFAEATGKFRHCTDMNWEFLNQSLVHQVGSRLRGGVRVITCRRWRTPIKKSQIEAIKNIKSCPNLQVVQSVSQQLCELIDQYCPGRPFDAVCPVPTGSSASEYNFASLIALELSRKTGLPLWLGLRNSTENRKINSHPRNSLGFQTAISVAGEPPKFILIVDDIVTTGLHIKKCSEVIVDAGSSCMAISWIGP